jgi:hypothetical protein
MAVVLGMTACSDTESTEPSSNLDSNEVAYVSAGWSGGSDVDISNKVEFICPKNGNIGTGCRDGAGSNCRQIIKCKEAKTTSQGIPEMDEIDIMCAVHTTWKVENDIIFPHQYEESYQWFHEALVNFYY